MHHIIDHETTNSLNKEQESKSICAIILAIVASTTTLYTHPVLKMAEEPNQPDAIRFKHEQHDVTCCCEYICCGNTKLILGEEEAELIQQVCFGICTQKKRGPYGELGTVDASTTCCFYGFGAASLMPQGQPVQCTGCGCEKQKVDALVLELKRRQEMRGDRAKIRLQETTVDSLKLLHQKVDLILERMELGAPTSDRMDRGFTTAFPGEVGERAIASSQKTPSSAPHQHKHHYAKHSAKKHSQKESMKGSTLQQS